MPGSPQTAVLIAALALTAIAPGLALDITVGGEAKASIVIPDEALPVVAAAAGELQHHVELASGATLPIVSEGKAPEAGGLIYLGPCRRTLAAGIDPGDLEPNEFVIKLIDGDLFIVGDDTDGQPFWIQHNNRERVGTLFGVYEFLETHLSVRWLWPGDLGTVVPSVLDIQVTAWDQTGAPPLIHSRWREGGKPSAGTQGWSSQEVRSRYINAQGRWLRRHRFAMGINMDMHHAFTQWWDRFNEDHPDFFNLLPDGTRRPDPTAWGGSPSLISMCVSNPEFWKQIVADWDARRTPQNPYIDASENDTAGKCTCPKCMAMDVPDPDSDVPFDERLALAKAAFDNGEKGWEKNLGALSDRYARYYLGVQAEAEKIDPEAVVMGYAYANYAAPPRDTTLNERIIIGIVPPLMYPWTDEARRTVREQWDGWSATGARLFLRPNYMLDGHNMPIFVARKLGEDFSYAAAHGMIGTDFDSLTGQWSTQGPNLYMLARLHRRPELPVEEVLGEYYSGFGPARDAVRAYFAHWEQVSDAVTKDLYADAEMHWSYLYRDADRIFTPQVMTRGRELLDQAVAAAKPDAQAAERVAFLDKGLRNVELTLATQRAFRAYKASGNITGFTNAIRALDAYRAEVEADFVANMAYLEWAEARTWDRKMPALMAEPGEPLPEVWSFRWDPEDKGEAERWFADDLDVAVWLSTRIDGPWEQQDVGKAWKAEHEEDYNGLAWYRTTFEVEPEDLDRPVRLVFEAVDEACKVWVNGTQLLDRPFPYQGNVDSWQEAFEVDVSQVVRADRPNTLAVRVEDNAGAGGIWRQVWLVTTPPPVPDEKNAIQDGGFEARSGAWKKSIMCGKFTLTLDETQAHSGRVSGKLQCAELAPPEAKEKYRTRAWARWYQPLKGLVRGGKYELRAWVKTSNDFTGSLNIWVTGTTKQTMDARTLSTAGLWRELVMKDIVPAEDTRGLYLNLMGGTGTAWFDDLSLVQIAE